MGKPYAEEHNISSIDPYIISDITNKYITSSPFQYNYNINKNKYTNIMFMKESQSIPQLTN